MSRLSIPSDPALPRHDGYADVVYTGRILAKAIEKGGFATLGELLGEDSVRFLGPIIRTKDKTTGQYDDGKRVGRVVVNGHKNGLIGIKALIGFGEKETVVEGWVDPKNVRFKSSGPVMAELREQGVKLERAEILS
jgi:hypothetical protein